MKYLTTNDHLTDRISHRGKFFLIFGHYISNHHFFVMVEVKGVSFQFPSCFRDFFQGKVEQTAVVSFELDGSVFFQNLVVAGKKLPGGKAAGSVASLRPGIREIQIDSGNFAFFKNFGKKSCIHAHEF